jgi:hypothetical protein
LSIRSAGILAQASSLYFVFPREIIKDFALSDQDSTSYETKLGSYSGGSARDFHPASLAKKVAFRCEYFFFILLLVDIFVNTNHYRIIRTS